VQNQTDDSTLASNDQFRTPHNFADRGYSLKLINIARSRHVRCVQSDSYGTSVRDTWCDERHMEII